MPRWLRDFPWALPLPPQIFSLPDGDNEVYPRLAFGLFSKMAPNVAEAMTALKMALCGGNGKDKAAKVRCPRGQFDRKLQTRD